MKWQGRSGSTNIEDRRGMRMAMPVGGGIGGIVLLLLYSALTGQNPIDVVGNVASPTEEVEPTGAPANDQQAQFISVVLKSTEDVWTKVFDEHSARYEQPVLVLFSGATQSACGLGESAMGPFYCPGDRKVYLDLSFFQELADRFGAPGDFARAYVVAHEVGHHVQTLTGISERVAAARQQSRASGNALSVRQELQADCYAGVWGHYAARDNLLEPGDAEEGLRAAAAIGDDRLQQQSQGRVVPESFTHGSSEQRVEWLRRGLESGRLESCDTFSAQ